MKEKLAKLLSVKSIVTIVLTGVFSALALTHYITPDQTLNLHHDHCFFLRHAARKE